MGFMHEIQPDFLFLSLCISLCTYISLYVQIYLSMYRYISLCTDISPYVQIYLSMYRYISLCTDIKNIDGPHTRDGSEALPLPPNVSKPRRLFTPLCHLLCHHTHILFLLVYQARLLHLGKPSRSVVRSCVRAAIFSVSFSFSLSSSFSSSLSSSSSFYQTRKPRATISPEPRRKTFRTIRLHVDCTKTCAGKPARGKRRTTEGRKERRTKRRARSGVERGMFDFVGREPRRGTVMHVS